MVEISEDDGAMAMPGAGIKNYFMLELAMSMWTLTQLYLWIITKTIPYFDVRRLLAYTRVEETILTSLKVGKISREDEDKG